jgi:hypothetical protein
MRNQTTRWWIILGCWSCAACAAWAQPADSTPLAPPEPLPAEGYADNGSPYTSACCPGDRPAESGIRAWWLYRAKPALQYSHWGYPEEFEEVPFGARVRMAQRAQLCSGWMARLWLYRYDFCDESAALNPAGRKRLYELAREFPAWMHHALVIETTGIPELDAARREHVTRLLEEAGAPAHVVIGVTTVSAPFGDETRMWNTRFLNQVRSGGGTSTGGGAGGAAGGGMGGGAGNGASP